MRREREGKERIGEGKRDSGGGGGHAGSSIGNYVCNRAHVCVYFSLFCKFVVYFGSHTDTHSLLVNLSLTPS